MSRWPVVRLGDVVHLVGGGTPSKAEARYWQGSIPWASVRDLRGRWIETTEFRITEEALRESTSNVIPAGNVVIATRVGLGKVVQVAQDTAINQDLRGLIPKDMATLDPAYLYYWFETVAHLLVAAGTGATVQGVKVTFVAGMGIPLPPLDEQKRIVAKLDQVNHLMTSLARLRHGAVAALQPLLISCIDERLGGLSRETPRQPLGEVADLVRGPFGGSLKKSMFVESGFAVYEQQHAISGDVQSHRYFIDEEKYNSMRRFSVASGDILMSCAGTLGRVARISETSPPGVINQALLKLSPSLSLRSEFLARVLQGSGFQEFLRGGAAGSAMQNVAAISEIRKYLIPVPPIDVQDLIVDRLKNVEAKVADLNRVCEVRDSEGRLLANRFQSVMLRGAA